MKERINLKWIKDLNVSHKTIKALEENIGSKISDISLSNILSDISPQAREKKGKIYTPSLFSFFLFIDFIGARLVNKILPVASAQF